MVWAIFAPLCQNGILTEVNNMAAWEVIGDSDIRLGREWVKENESSWGYSALCAVPSNALFCMWGCRREDAAREECRHGCKVGVKTAMVADLHVDLPTLSGLVADSVLSVFMWVWEKAKKGKKMLKLLEFLCSSGAFFSAVTASPEFTVRTGQEDYLKILAVLLNPPPPSCFFLFSHLLLKACSTCHTNRRISICIKRASWKR